MFRTFSVLLNVVFVNTDNKLNRKWDVLLKSQAHEACRSTIGMQINKSMKQHSVEGVLRIVFLLCPLS